MSVNTNYLLACWQEWFMFIFLGRLIGVKHWARRWWQRSERKEARRRLQSPPTTPPPENPRRQERNRFFFTQDWPVHSEGLSFPRDRLKHVIVWAVIRVGLITQRMTRCFLQWPHCHTALGNDLQTNPHLRREGLSDLPQKVWSKWCEACRTPFCFCGGWPYHVACAILLPQPGTKPRLSAVRAQSPEHWIAKEFHQKPFWSLNKVEPFTHIFLKCIVISYTYMCT